MKENQDFQAAGSLRQAHGRALLAFACLAITLPLAFNPALFNDGDTSWHIAAGRLILEAGSVPRTDPFSYTFAGAPWTAHEWLAEVVMAGLHRIGGWSALALATSLSVALTLFLVGRDGLRFLTPLAASAATIGVALVLMPFIVARPHVLAWPILAAWTVTLLRARDRQKGPPLALALLMLVWANLHGSFALGLALAGFFGLEAVAYQQNRLEALKRWAVFGVTALVAAMVTPHGPQGLLFPLQVAGMHSLHLIGEWRPTNFATYPMFGIGLLAAAAVLVVRWRSIPLTRALLVVGLAWLAIEHVRHQAVFAIVAPFLLFRTASQPKASMRAISPAIAGALITAIAAISALRLAVPLERTDSRSNPLKAIASIPAEVRARPVLNSYAFGGPLILAGVRPYIDGRADMYGDAFMFEHRRLMTGDMDAFRRVTAERAIAWTIVSPLDPLSRKLDKEPGWRRIHADSWAVIHARD